MNITTLEAKVLTALIYNMGDCTGSDFSFGFIDEIEPTDLGLDAQQYGGVVSSLSQKQLISIDPVDAGEGEVPQFTTTHELHELLQIEDSYEFENMDFAQALKNRVAKETYSDAAGDEWEGQGTPNRKDAPAPVTKPVKIGRNKNHARILIENQVFAQYGWHPEQLIKLSYHNESKTITVTKHDNAANKLGGRMRGARQITRIEIGDAKLTEFVGDCTTATIEYSVEALRFTIGAV
jgi:hypothetical protein